MLFEFEEMAIDIHHALSVVTGILENIIFVGLLIGWSSLAPVLKCEGYFDQKCEGNLSSCFSLSSNQTLDIPQCPHQQESLVLLMSITFFCGSIGFTIAGFIFDKFGTLVTRVIGTLEITVGLVVIIYSSKDTSWRLYPAMILLSFGGSSLHITNLKLGNLFPGKRATIISLIEGATDASAIIFLLIKLAYNANINFETSLLVLTAFTGFLWLRTFIYMPVITIPFTLPKEGFQLGVYKELCIKSPTKVDTSISTNTTESEKTSIYTSLKDIRFWMNAAHMGILLLRMEMFLSVFGDWLFSTFPNYSNNELDRYINIYGGLFFSVLFLSPLYGLCLDALLKRFEMKSSDTATAKATCISLCITSAVGVIFSVCVCIPNLPFQYFSFVMFYAFIACLFCGHSSFIALVFPEQHFGRLITISMQIAALITLLKYPLSVLALRFLDEKFLPVHIGFIIACLLTFIHPLMFYMRSLNGGVQSPQTLEGLF